LPLSPSHTPQFKLHIYIDDISNFGCPCPAQIPLRIATQ
jgi:hypothetical protein